MAARILSFLAIAVGLTVLGLTAFHGDDASSRNSTSNERLHATLERKLASVPSSLTGEPRRLLAPASQVGEKAASDSLWQSSYNVVHVVSTRFMQHQAQLTNLAEARLDLFETFTLASMKQQTNQEFLWLIFADKEMPKEQIDFFHKNLPHNALLVAAEQEKGATFRTLYGHSWTTIHQSVLAGNIPMLYDYYLASDSHILMETRLDADDALSHTFIDSVQAQATLDLGKNRKPGDVRHFCPEHHIEWGYYQAHPSTGDLISTYSGYLTQMENEEFCIYSGKTTAYHLEASTHDVDGRALEIQEKRRLSPCEEHEIPKCPPLEKSCQELPFFNFNDDTTRGDWISDEFFMKKGVRFSTFSDLCYTPDKSMVNVNGTAGQMKIFDTRRPTGSQGGSDLCCDRPESKRRGKASTPPSCFFPGNQYKNDGDHDLYNLDVGNIGVIQETNKPCPDDCSYLGNHIIRVDFENPSSMLDGATLFSVIFIDVDDATRIRLTYLDGTTKIFRVKLTGNKGYVEYKFDGYPQDKVKTLEVLMRGSGVLGPMKYCWCRPLDCLRRLRVIPDGSEDQDAILMDRNPNTMTNIHASVLMARTPTAAGMKHVLPGKSGGGEHSRPLSTFVGGEAEQDRGWAIVEEEFGVSKKSVVGVRQRIEKNMEKILIDAFNGQCTPGHSCKESTKRALGYLLDLERLKNQKKEKESH